jgi:purine nucleosidase
MTPPIPVVIDTDIGSDPDDALALVLALASPEVDVRGISIVSGDVRWRSRMAARLLGMAGRPDIPVLLGRGELLDAAHDAVMDGNEGLGLLDLPYDGPVATVHSTPAIDWLIAESRRAPFHLVAIGPLTNVALALERDPELRARLLGLTAMGGLLDPRTMPEAWRRDIAQRGEAAWSDYNTTSDPAAALTTARTASPITWVTLDVTMRAPLRQASRDMLPADRPLGQALGRMIDHWHATWFPTALPAPYDPNPVPADAVAILHDPLAVASLFAGDWLRLRQTRLVYGIEDGIFRMHESAHGMPGQLAGSVDGAAFEAFCMARILRQISR